MSSKSIINLIYDDKVIFYQVFIQAAKIICEDIGYPAKEL